MCFKKYSVKSNHMHIIDFNVHVVRCGTGLLGQHTHAHVRGPRCSAAEDDDDDTVLPLVSRDVPGDVSSVLIINHTLGQN